MSVMWCHVSIHQWWRIIRRYLKFGAHQVIHIASIQSKCIDDNMDFCNGKCANIKWVLMILMDVISTGWASFHTCLLIDIIAWVYFVPVCWACRFVLDHHCVVHSTCHSWHPTIVIGIIYNNACFAIHGAWWKGDDLTMHATPYKK